MSRQWTGLVLVALVGAASAVAQTAVPHVTVAGHSIPQCQMRGSTAWGPAGDVARAMAAEVDWQDAAQRLVIHTRAGKTLSLQAGYSTLNAAGRAVDMGAAAEVLGNDVIAPLRPVIDALGAAVRWDAATLTLKAIPRLVSVVSRASGRGAIVEIATAGPCTGRTDADEWPPRAYVDLRGVIGNGDGINYVNVGGLLRVRWAQYDQDAAVLRVVGDLRKTDTGRWEPDPSGCGGRLIFGTPQGNEPVIARAKPRLTNVAAQQPNSDTTVISASLTDAVGVGYQLLRRPDRLLIELPAEPMGAGNVLPVAGELVSGVQFLRGSETGNAQLLLYLPQLVRFDVRAAESPDRVEFVFRRKSLVGEVIYVDPGHGGKDSGGRGSTLLEKDVNLDVGRRLVSLLGAAGARPMMTRDRDIFIDLHERPRMANNCRADMYLSIHCNASGGVGTETYWFQQQSQVLANVVHDRLVGGLRRPNRGVFKHSFCVVRESQMPSALVELMFIDRQPEEGLLAQIATRQTAAAALFEGLREFVSGTASVPPSTDSNTLTMQ
jgi:N-acetylmuramoyl-L-alanine amidase